MDLINGDVVKIGEEHWREREREGHLHSRPPACGPQDREHPGEHRGLLLTRSAADVERGLSPLPISARQ